MPCSSKPDHDVERSAVHFWRAALPGGPLARRLPRAALSAARERTTKPLTPHVASPHGTLAFRPGHHARPPDADSAAASSKATTSSTPRRLSSTNAVSLANGAAFAIAARARTLRPAATRFHARLESATRSRTTRHRTRDFAAASRLPTPLHRRARAETHSSAARPDAPDGDPSRVDSDRAPFVDFCNRCNPRAQPRTDRSPAWPPKSSPRLAPKLVAALTPPPLRPRRMALPDAPASPDLAIRRAATT